MAEAPDPHEPPGSLRTAVSGRPPENRAALVHMVLAEADAASSVLVLTPRSSSARAWRSELLRRSPELSGFVRVSTPLGFAMALLRGEHEGVKLLHLAQRRSLVAELLGSEAGGEHVASLWPTQRRFLLGPSFLDEVLRELAERVDAATADRSEGSVAPGRGEELAAFMWRYEALLSERSLVDAPRALRTACDRLWVDDPVVDGLDPARCLVVDQRNVFGPGAAPLIDAVIARARRRRVDVVVSTTAYAPLEASTDDRRCSMLRVHHPALEADAAVSVVRAWLDAGCEPMRLAIVLPRHDAVLLSELVASSSRSSVPLVVPGVRVGDHQIVNECARAIVCAGQTRRGGDLAGHAYSWWLSNAASLLSDREAVEVISAFIRALTNGDSVDAALERPSPPRVGHGVSVLSLDEAIDRPSDEPWHGVVIVGCVDGSFPRRRVRRPWFRPDPIPGVDTGTGIDGPTAEDELVDHDRRRLAALLGAVAPNGSVVAIAAPVGGVLPSPLIDGWRRDELSLVRVASTPPPRPTTDTTTDVPLFPSGSLRLSATQLTTFEDCSWRYGFEYALGLRGAGGAPATAGSLVHEVLESFLCAGTSDHSRARLLELLEELWKDHEFPYTAQALDYRRRAEQWLGNWWQFFRDTAPDVRLTEHRFEVPFPPLESGAVEPPAHTLVGSIDRIDVIAPLAAAEQPRIRIVDYKSGSPKSQDEVDHDLQLAIYHYAATHDPLVRELGTADRLELHYLQDDMSRERVKVLSRAVTAGLEDDTVARINALVTSILREDYSPNPDANCDYCAFHTLCPTKLQGRHVR